MFECLEIRRHAVEEAHGGEQQAGLLLFLRQRQQKRDHVAIARHAPRQRLIKRRSAMRLLVCETEVAVPKGGSGRAGTGQGQYSLCRKGHNAAP
jgi:hypothetical protein